MYESIAPYYHYIFPLKPQRKKFLKQHIAKPKSKVLDIGCATGQLAVSLAEEGYCVTGLDLDPEMIDIARKSTQLPIEFLHLNMMDIQVQFRTERFDTVLCLGNTLPHLSNIDQIKSFLDSVFKILNPDGKFILMVINFDRIRREEIRQLPDLETDLIKFERSYFMTPTQAKFTTRLTLKEKSKTIEGSETLYPISYDDLHHCLGEAGFSRCQFFGDEKGSKFSPASPAVIGIGVKRG